MFNHWLDKWLSLLFNIQPLNYSYVEDLFTTVQCQVYTANIWRGVWNKALSDFWCIVKFS